MAPGLPDRVDCARLADDAAVLERTYALEELPRLRDLLADTRGSLRANFAFEKFAAGRIGATVAIEADPHLVCQRCVQGFEFPAAAVSEVEFTADELAAGVESTREMYAMNAGSVSLRDLAEEELLLALPVVAVCATPEVCGRAPVFADGAEPANEPAGRTRPFAGLQEMLKKTR